MTMNQDICNINQYDLKMFAHQALRQDLIAKFGEINESKSLINFIAFVGQHILGWLAIVYFDDIFITIIASIYMSFNLMGLYIVLHDAGHRTRSKNINLNDFEGDIAGGLVGCGISWILARESHRQHHLDTGKIDDPTALWLPMTVEEYAEASKVNRFLYKLKMTNVLFAGLEFVNFIRQNVWSILIAAWPKKKLRNEIIRSLAVGLTMTLLEVWLAVNLIGFYGLFFIYLLPRFIFVSGGAILDRMNHANPEIMFYSHDDWHTDASNMQGTIRIEYHPIINYLINDMNEHTIHHYVPSIPGHNLKAARLYVEQKYPLLLNKRPFSWQYLWDIYAQCHLVESSDNLRFTSFNAAQRQLTEA